MSAFTKIIYWFKNLPMVNLVFSSIYSSIQSKLVMNIFCMLYLNSQEFGKTVSKVERYSVISCQLFCWKIKKNRNQPNESMSKQKTELSHFFSMWAIVPAQINPLHGQINKAKNWVHAWTTNINNRVAWIFGSIPRDTCINLWVVLKFCI